MQCWVWLCDKYGKMEDACALMCWVVCGLWRIWKCRNNVVFEKIVIDPTVAMHLFRQQWEEIVESDEELLPCKVPGQSGCGTISNGWIKPPFGVIKINCDDAWCSHDGVGGYGWVARDFAGIFKGASGVGKVLCDSSIMAEAEALRMAIIAAVERGFGSVLLETDSKILVDMIHGKLQPDATLKGILWDITTIKQHLCSIKFLYTPRACNEVVHLVASYVTHVGSVHSWDELEPEWLFNTLASDVNISIRI
ncbi:hypothetical protein ACFX16_009840 [Malus domestica]